MRAEELPPLEFEVPVAEKLAVRAWSWKPEALERSATREFQARLVQADEHGTASPVDYRISVFARGRGPTESTTELLASLISHAKAQLGEVRWIAAVTETELAEEGFSLELSEPPPHHHDIVLGDHPETLRSQVLCDVFSIHERIRVR